jgi:hypothetical protein
MPSQVNTLPIVKSQIRSKHKSDMHERQKLVERAGSALPGFEARRGTNRRPGKQKKMPPASNQVSVTLLEHPIQQTYPHGRVRRASGVCVARDLTELRDTSHYIRIYATCECEIP